MWAWMYATRIPAMRAANIDPQTAADTGALKELPANVRQVADNYNHLHEQPTIFYAAALAIEVSGQADGFAIALAWLYVLSRVAHSAVQATVNLVVLRFAVFAVGSLVLALMAIRGLLSFW